MRIIIEEKDYKIWETIKKFLAKFDLKIEKEKKE